MMDAQRKTPGSNRGQESAKAGGNSSVKYTTPSGFWKGFAGTQSMGPPVYRKTPKPSDTWWRPERGQR